MTAKPGYSLNSYWEESSYGQTSATGEVFGPFALTSDFDCTDNDNLAAAAIRAASSVDFTQFDRVALPNQARFVLPEGTARLKPLLSPRFHRDDGSSSRAAASAFPSFPRPGPTFC